MFDLFQGHQDGRYAPVSWEIAPAAIQKGLPQLDLSASVRDGRLTVTLVNLSAGDEARVELALCGAKPARAKGRVLHGRPTDHNTFDEPRRVDTAALETVALQGDGVRATLPPCAIAALEIELA